MVLGHQQTNKENTGSDARQELLLKLLGSGVLNSVKVKVAAHSTPAETAALASNLCAC